MNDYLIERIREATDLTKLAGTYVTLRKSGGKWQGLCPFHQEKTPSLVVWPTHFVCFGCGAKGSSIDFYMQIEGVPFSKALHDLAARAGITVESRKPLTPAIKVRAAEEADICLWWWKRYTDRLEDDLRAALGDLEPTEIRGDMHQRRYRWLDGSTRDEGWADVVSRLITTVRGMSVASKFALYQRLVTPEDRAAYARHVMEEKAFMSIGQ